MCLHAKSRRSQINLRLGTCGQNIYELAVSNNTYPGSVLVNIAKLVSLQ